MYRLVVVRIPSFGIVHISACQKNTEDSPNRHGGIRRPGQSQGPHQFVTTHVLVLEATYLVMIDSSSNEQLYWRRITVNWGAGGILFSVSPYA